MTTPAQKLKCIELLDLLRLHLDTLESVEPEKINEFLSKYGDELIDPLENVVQVLEKTIE